MGYNNYNRGGYGSRDYGYNNRGYGRDNYSRGGYEPTTNIPFEVGQIVRHIATGTELSVVRIGREQVECRLPDLSSNWFYVHELAPVDSEQK
jgi:hypothetical protein